MIPAHPIQYLDIIPRVTSTPAVHTRYVGIDVGFVATGVVLVRLDMAGLFVELGKTIRTKPRNRKLGIRTADDDADRCMTIARELRELLTGVAVECVAVELPGGGARDARALRGMALATGVVIATLEAVAVRTEYVTPTDVKIAATGHALASKEEVITGVLRRLSWTFDLNDRPKGDREHIADAAGAVLASSVNVGRPLYLSPLEPSTGKEGGPSGGRPGR